MKKVKVLLVGILVSFILPIMVNAASANISIKTSGQAVVGNTITATVNLSSGTPMGSWQYVISYDSSKLQLVSGQTNVADYTSTASGVKSKSYTLKFKILKSGSASINVGSYLIYAIDDSQMSVNASNASIKSMTQAELEATYSKNNNLKFLGVEGYEISPAFNKDTLEYTAVVPSTVDKINITATKEDGTASIDGAGEKEVKEGANPFEITVTAQNGATKTYKLVVTVEDINPIEVKIGGTTYNVVKRADNIETKPKGFEETTITINEVEVPAFKSETLGLTLVGIKDEKGNVKLAIYNDGKYSLYEEINSNNITIYLLDLKELKGFEKTTVEINGTEVEAYKLSNDFVIIYGKNVETGDESFYIYDIKEKTFQRYNDEKLNELKKQMKTYMYVIYAFGGTIILIFICFIISCIAKSKRKRRLAKIENIKEKEAVEDFLDEKPKKKTK